MAGVFFALLLVLVIGNGFAAYILQSYHANAVAKLDTLDRMRVLGLQTALQSVRLTDANHALDAYLGGGVDVFSQSLAALEHGGAVAGREIAPLEDPRLRAYLPKIQRDWESFRSRVQSVVLDSYSVKGLSDVGHTGVSSSVLRQWVIDDAEALTQSLQALSHELLEVVQRRKALALGLGAGLLAIDLLVLLVAFVLVRRRLISPLRKLHLSCRDWMRGHFATRIDYKGTDELSDLVQAFNSGAQRIQDLLETTRKDRIGRERSDTIFRGLAVNSMVGIYLAEGERFSFVSAKMAEIFGYTPQEMIDTLPVMGVIVPRERYLVAESIKASLKRKDGTVRYERHGRRKDGTVIDVEVFSSSLQVGEATAIIGIVQDITERKNAEASAQLAGIAYENSGEAIAVTDAAGVIMDVNPAYARITGRWADEVVGEMLPLLKPGRHNRDFYDAMWHAINTTGRWEGEYWSRRKSGEDYAERVVVDTAWNHDGSVNCRVAMVSDITEKKHAEKQVWWQAHHDPLTALPNRQYFNDRLERSVERVARGGPPLALMFLDLDGFKAINDSMGHAVGDQVLTEVAGRLRACAGEAGFVARLGGDEFVVLLGGAGDQAQVEGLRRDIMRSVTAPYLMAGESLRVSASIGIALYPKDAEDKDSLLRHVDLAMYAAKAEGPNHHRYFDKDMRTRARMLRDLVQGLPGALADEQFFLVYQPIYDMGTGRLSEAEALLRWNHPELGIIRPMDFLPMVEDRQLIGTIGDWVLDRVATQASDWRARYGGEFRVAVNVSPAQLEGGEGNRLEWLECLRRHGLAADGIVLEFSERALAGMGVGALANLRSLREAGMGIGLDAFGIGSASMSTIGRMPADYIKLDHATTAHIVEDVQALHVCEAIILLAHKLGVQVIAEGVTSEAQHELLLRAGCDAGQGYWYDEPLEPAGLERRLAERRGRVARGV
ncbi:EAL domain-containing protein [Castellaniella sp. GW247-6E4]|uniref:bifunctional diguanylate cyclase/phosphodiesterase n=1 Tax=Castellaniella sp. GW247-6E4 TaxID=3140380 RepID=UPI003315E4E0